MGVAITRKTLGPCRALDWSAEQAVYRCGLLTSPHTFVPWLPQAVVRRVARRWIAADTRCDANLERADSKPENPGSD